MKIIIYSVTVFFLLCVLPAFAEMFIWTGANGVKHYSDTAPATPVENIETGQIVEHDEDYYRQAEYEKLIEDQILEQKAAIQKAKDHYKTKAWEYNREIKRSSERIKAIQKQRETEATRRNVIRLETKKNEYENLKGDMYTREGKQWADKNAQEAQAELEKEKARLRDVELHGN